MKIAFLLPVVSQVRYQKRVMSLERLGVEPKILSFERKYYQGVPWPQGYISLGRIQHGHYWRRLPRIIMAIPIVRRTAADADVLYAFGLDTLLLAHLAIIFTRQKPKVVYEVGDIRSILVKKNFLGRSLRAVERFLVRRSSLIVVTSHAYINEYFLKIQRLEGVRYHVIENKLTNFNDLPITLDSSLDKRDHDEIRIGYFGLIRCRRSWEVLKKIALRGNGKFRVVIRGILSESLMDLHSEMTQTRFVEFGGPYISPDDLPAMYGSIDLAWIAHFANETNIKWSRVNRFYEACYFYRPMIAQTGTQDGFVVEERGLGLCIDLQNKEKAIQNVLEIDKSDIEKWRENIFRLPRNVCVYTDEHEKLLSYLRNGLVA